MAELEAEEAESEEEFVHLEIKLAINKYKAENPNEKKIPSELMS